MVEEWRRVVGFESHYCVSNLGRVRSDHANFAGRILKPGKMRNGYLFVNLHVDGVGSTRLVHRLVAAAFIGPCDESHEVNHIDGDKTNNRDVNLEYVTRVGNMQHASRTGLLPFKRLWDDDISAIRERYRAGDRADDLAREFGMSESGIRNYVRDIKRDRNHKLTDDDVRTIRASYAAGDRSQQSIADEFDVNQTLISAIVRRVAWVHVTT